MLQKLKIFVDKQKAIFFKKRRFTLEIIKRAVLLVFMLNLFAPCVFARGEGAITELALFGEEDLVVTASRYEQKVSEAPAIIDVITADEIKKSGATNLIDVLKHLPGAIESLAMSGRVNLIFRGHDSGAIKFMIDGHPINQLLYGDFDNWCKIDLDIVKQIEVIRGPGSALYGTDAFSGVINIITKKGSDINGVEVNINGGSFETGGGSILIGNKIKDTLTYKLFFQHTKSDGPRGKLEYDLLQGTPYTLCPGKMNEGFETTTLNFGLEDTDFYLRGMYLKSAKDNLIGAMFALVEDSEVSTNEYFIEGAYVFRVNENTSFTPKAYYHYWNNKQLDGVLLPKGYYMIVPTMPPYIPQDFNGDGLLEYWPEGALAEAGEKEELYGIEFKLEMPLTDAGKFIGGIFFEGTKVFDVVTKANIDPVYFFNLGTFMDVSDTRNFNAGGERTVHGGFAQVDWKLKDNLNALVGARYDHYDDFGETFNPRCGLVWEFNKKGNVKFLYGSAFRAPTFGQLYNDNQPVVMGNKDLKPEKIQTGEISLNYSPINKLNTIVTIFQSKIKDGIGMDVSGKIMPTDPAIWGNVLELDSTGVETEAKYYLWEKTYLSGSFVYIESEKGDEETAGIPRNSGSFGLNLNFAKHYNWKTMLYYVGEKPRDVAGGDIRDSVSSYTLVDTAFLIEDIIKGMDIKFIVKNLFDKEYYYPSMQATADIIRPGISYYASMGYKF